MRKQTLLTEVLSAMRERMPFALLGFDTDNDSVFMNETVKTYRGSRPLRGRPKPVKTIRSGLLDRFLIVEDSRCLHFLEICVPVVSPLTACFKLRESPSGLALKVEGSYMDEEPSSQSV